MERKELKLTKKIKDKILSFLAIAGITILCFLLRWFLNPTGFWQNFAVFGAGVLLLGGFQIFGLIFWLIIMFYAIFPN